MWCIGATWEYTVDFCFYMKVIKSLSIRPSIHQFIRPSVRPSVSVYLPVCLASVYLPIASSVHLSSLSYHIFIYTHFSLYSSSTEFHCTSILKEKLKTLESISVPFKFSSSQTIHWNLFAVLIQRLTSLCSCAERRQRRGERHVSKTLSVYRQHLLTRPHTIQSNA